MSTSTTTTAYTSVQEPVASSRSWVGRTPGKRSRVAPGHRRRRLPYLTAGVLLVVMCAAGAVVTVLAVGQRAPMLSLARPVDVGHVLGPQDLREVPLSADSDTDLIPAAQSRSVLGRPVAYSLPTGSLLTHAALGSPRIPPLGQAIVAVAAQPGQMPPDLAPGTRVTVIPTPDTNTGTTTSAPVGGPWPGVVTDVSVPGSDQSTVVSLQMPVANARQVAAVPAGEVSLVAVERGGR